MPGRTRVRAVRILDDARVDALARVVLSTVDREYPHKLDQELTSDEDVIPPRLLNPCFFGSYDWHSAVHSHWTLARALRRGLPGEVAKVAVAALETHLTEERVAGELRFFESPGGGRSERPYGWAWLALLHAEASMPCHREGHRWGGNLGPLRDLLHERLLRHLATDLQYPIRSGTHGNTALTLYLLLKAARLTGDSVTQKTVAELGLRFYRADSDLPWDGRPSGSDFLSPTLSEAALMAEILEPDEFSSWLVGAGAGTARSPWTPPQIAADDRDLTGAHLEGLLLSRAWSLAAILGAVRGELGDVVDLRRGLASHVSLARGIRVGDGFHRAHWLPTFMLFLDDHLVALDAGPRGLSRAPLSQE
ncbi:MAG: DUF2891 family protein [Candidatus Dormibacteraeota bacterium]|nr:DUF2891 family protein [Candidatus Dormibacteraeota bacterium]